MIKCNFTKAEIVFILLEKRRHSVIKVVAKNYIKREKLEEFIILASQLVKDTNSKDKGCIAYDVFQDITDSQIFTFIEEWEDKEALDQHMIADHFKEAAAKFKDLVEKPGDINLYKKAK